MAGGTLAPGTTAAPGDVGTLTFDNSTTTTNLSIGTGSIFQWDLTSESTSSGFDMVIGDGGSLTNGGTFQIVVPDGWTFGSSFWDSNQTWSVFTGFGSLPGTWAISVVDQSGNPVDTSAQGTFSASGGQVTWAFSAVPEPENIIVGLLLATGIFHRKRNYR